LGKGGWTDLEKWLQQFGANDDTPKIISCASPIAPGFSRYLDCRDRLDGDAAVDADNWQAFDHERRRLFDLIADGGIRNVVLLGGDYHCSAVAQVTRKGASVALAILAPPAYAPLAYANDKADDLALREITGEYTIDICKVVATGVAGAAVPVRMDGSGYVAIEFYRRNGKWTVKTTFELCRICAGNEPVEATGWETFVCDVAL
jgi:hypothetical protein